MKRIQKNKQRGAIDLKPLLFFISVISLETFLELQYFRIGNAVISNLTTDSDRLSFTTNSNVGPLLHSFPLIQNDQGFGLLKFL